MAVRLNPPQNCTESRERKPELKKRRIEKLVYPNGMAARATPKSQGSRYFRVIFWTSVCVIALTAAQYGSVRLLAGRPSSWLFEAFLDLAPPLLFMGDIAQLAYTQGSQAPLRDQLHAVGFGVLVNIFIYSAIAIVVTWLFFPRVRRIA
jgi:hypothetical protein